MQPIPANRIATGSVPASAVHGIGLAHPLAALVLASGLLLGAGAVHAQAKRCDLVGRDTTLSGNPAAFKRCLDLSALDGKTVEIPSNVTRIDNDGLSLCKGAAQSGGDADIVYIYDNSGSMTPRFGYINTATNDTTYYETAANCASTATNGTFSYTYWNASGTFQDQSRTVTRLVSNAGCTEFAGDPYQSRARAYYLGIKDQAARAPQSTAGIMSFATSTGNRVLPRKLNTQGNIDAILAGINAGNNGGTAYRPPTDTAKAWLTNSSITSNPKKAIIFLSDGKPKDDSPIWTGPSTGMPPIYGIFLGRPRVDTAALYSMSQATGGKFYLIPPDDPDSLKSVVAAILNIVLLEYSPQTASVTNSSISPSQTATSASSDFVLQPDGSWLMKLSDIIGLKPGASNSISVSTTFKEKTSLSLETKNITFTLSTTGTAAGTTQKIGNTQFGTVCYDKSALAILGGSNLSAPPLRPAYFTDTNTVYQVRIRTAPTPLDSALAAAATGGKGDAESPKFKPASQSTADSLVFRNAFPFKVISGARTSGNGTLESSLYDSIIVSWTHPRDPQDFASDTMRVRAGTQQPQIWFSQSNGGPATNQYPATASVIYVVVKDQAPDPRKTYSVVVTSETFNLDKETVTLAELTPGSGTLVGQISVSNAIKALANGKLEVSVGGDQLRAVYKDPVDGETAEATAGFDQLVEEAPALRFTDADGNLLAPGTIWSPAKGKLYFDYSDDALSGTLGAKQVFLTLASKKYGATLAADHERIATAYAGPLSATRGHWKGSIDLADAMPSDSNGKAETRYRGEATLTATAHDNKGAAQNLSVSDFLVIAYPDSQAGIQWKMDTTVASGEGMIFTVTDQSFTTDKDTVLISVACLKSGDSVAAFPAAEGPTAVSGIYGTGTLAKDEGAPTLGDRTLSCLTTDQIRVRYADPVYGGVTELIINEVAKPVATPADKRFITSESVTLTSATPGAVIWYTLDGSKPVPGKSLAYSEPIRINVTTTLKAIAVAPGMKDSKILTSVYTKESIASKLEILDENGNAIAGGALTGASKGIRLKLITTQDNLTSADVPVLTRAAGDAQTAVLGLTGSLGNAIELGGALPLRSPASRVADNDTLEAAGNDTVIARWVNPFNPADIAADTIVIKPAFVAAEVYFSAIENGPRITEYPVNTDTVYIVVKTRPRDPALTYTVALTSAETGHDSETVSLTEVSPGVFTGKLKVSSSQAKAKLDGVIQVAAAGDQLTAVFTDPVYKDKYRGDAGFARQVQESAQLEFIDETGNTLSPADVWSPAKGKVYVRYTDDWNAGIDSLIGQKAVRFGLVNKKSGTAIGADAETLFIALKSHSGSRGTWEGSLVLADKAAAKAGNDTLETYYRGELHAAVTPHDNAGAAETGEAGDDLVIAYPDQPAVIIVRDTSGGSVARKTDQVEIIIRDQPVTQSGTGSIIATVTCSQSGDRVEKVVLVWDGTQYVAKPPLDKGEVTSGTPNKTDAILACRENDILTVVYEDPVYGTPRSAEVTWTDDTQPDFWYASAKDGSRITSATDGTENEFVIIVKGVSPSRDKADTIMVTLSIGSGEVETFPAVETGAFTGEFRAKASYRFQTGDPKSGNGAMEAKIDPSKSVNQAVVSGEAKIGGKTVGADLALLSIFDLAISAWAKDEDADGRADHLYFRFDHKLARLPDGLPEAYWNEGSSGFKQKAGASQLAFVKGDSTLVVADFSKSQFGFGLTGIPDGKPVPTALFPDDNLFGSQRRALADSVGPIPMTAVKLPSDGKTYPVTETEWRMSPDTLLITVSEKLRTGASFSELFRFSKGCREYSESVPLRLFGLPEVSADGISYKAIVDNSLETQRPNVGDCLFLETDGRFADMRANLPAKLGAEITGKDPKLVIRSFKPYPPVAGIDAGSATGSAVFTTANQDVVGDHNYRRDDLQVGWVPPVGFDANDPMGSLDRVAREFTNTQAGDRAAERSYPQPMPSGISTVQVITRTAYLARISIFDNLGNFVRSMTQAFGHNGELQNNYRVQNDGLVSFLVWDMKDSHGMPVGQGVYVWKVSFTFQEANKKSEVRFTRTGVLRQR